MAMMDSIRRRLFRVALAVPPAVYFTDTFYSLCRVEDSSMEPALRRGDVLLVRNQRRCRPHLAPGALSRVRDGAHCAR